MTLKEWEEKTGKHSVRHTGGGLYVDRPNPSWQPDPYSDLWHLSDYTVSTVSGPTIWLVPR